MRELLHINDTRKTSESLTYLNIHLQNIHSPVGRVEQRWRLPGLQVNSARPGEPAKKRQMRKAVHRGGQCEAR